MNSPKSQVRTGSNWKSVLWHEFCHVVTLQKTGNKMPRWLSEGISVYEERERDPSWGQVLSPTWREWILRGELTPVSELSDAFVKPASAEHLQFAYFQSSLVVDFLIETYGLQTLQRMLIDLEVGMPINQVLERYAGDVKLLDTEFAAYAKDRAKSLAMAADWTKPQGLGGASSVSAWESWNREHPDNVFGLRALASALMKEERWEEARAKLQRFTEVYPDYRGPNDAWSMLATVARATNDPESEFVALQNASRLKSGDRAVYERLIRLASEREDWEEVTKQAERWLSLNPLIPAPHRFLAQAAEQRGAYAAAIPSLNALTQLDPMDPADTYYRYAMALYKCGQLRQAKRQILKCLEQAPRYQDAHRLLLKIVEPPLNEVTKPADATADDGSESPVPDPPSEKDP